MLLMVGVMTSSTLVPRFTVEPRSSVVRAGSSVALTCAVRPPGANIRWTLNGSTISTPAARRRGIELSRDGQLLIGAYNSLSSTPVAASSSSSVSATGRVSHDGVYQCAAVTQAGVIVSSEAELQTACTTRSTYIHTYRGVATAGDTGDPCTLPCPPTSKFQQTVCLPS